MPVQVRRPKAIVFDILGTASKSGFLERVLFPFLKVNLDGYITSHWQKKEFIRLYNKIVEQSIEFNKQEPTTPVVLPHDNSAARGSLMSFIDFVTNNAINSPAVTQLRFKVWFEGYQQSKLRTPIYSDVPNKVRKWFAEGIKFYVFSNTWTEAQKALLKNTNHGDLTNLISGHYDNDFGILTEADSWRRLANEIHESPNDVLFLTKSPAEGRAAADAGMAVVLVLTHRHNVKAVSVEDRQRFPYVRTLNDLLWLEGSMMPGTESSAAAMQTDRSAMPIQGPVATAMSAGNASGSSQPQQQPLVSGGSAQVSAGAASSSRPQSHHSSTATATGGAGATGASGASGANSSSATSGGHSSHKGHPSSGRQQSG